MRRIVLKVAQSRVRRGFEIQFVRDERSTDAVILDLISTKSIRIHFQTVVRKS